MHSRRFTTFATEEDLEHALQVRHPPSSEEACLQYIVKTQRLQSWTDHHRAGLLTSETSPYVWGILRIGWCEAKTHDSSRVLLQSY